MIYPNEFPYLFDEIVRQDCYRLRDVQFIPTVVLDIGANVGVFSTYSAFMFPTSTIVAVEPDKRNWELLMEYTMHLPNVTRLNAALGMGTLWHRPVECLCAPYYGGGTQYVSEQQLGESQEWLTANHEYRKCAVESVSLSELVERYVDRKDLTVLKVDVEGAENSIFNHEPSMAALSRMDFITMEIHYQLDGTGPVYDHTQPTIRQSLMSLEGTHTCVLDEEHNLFRATRRILCD